LLDLLDPGQPGVAVLDRCGDRGAGTILLHVGMWDMVTRAVYTQDWHGPVLRFSAECWRRFAGQVKRPLAPELQLADLDIPGIWVLADVGVEISL